VSAEQIPIIPPCEECRKVWLPSDAERWQAYWIDDGPDDKLVFYCPACARRDSPRCAQRREQIRADAEVRQQQFEAAERKEPWRSSYTKTQDAGSSDQEDGSRRGHPPLEVGPDCRQGPRGAPQQQGAGEPQPIGAEPSAVRR
jgi:hypothetical protein